ncbi:MAG: hypothetical protein FJ038_13530 [Chloroflexi bacterium]|nr:hypothetical protein [Chloroflexota bacterium]
MTAAHGSRRPGWLRLESRSDRATAVASLAACILILTIVSPSVGGRPPGDPDAFAADARYARCGGGTVPTRYAFEIQQARHYRDHLPAMEPTTELALDEPALVVVFEGLGPFVATPTARPGRTAEPVRTAAPGVHDVCIYVGEAGRGQLNYYRDVSIAGLRVVRDGPALEPGDPSGSS